MLQARGALITIVVGSKEFRQLIVTLGPEIRRILTTTVRQLLNLCALLVQLVPSVANLHDWTRLRC